VLVVEDEPHVRRALGTFLRRHGFDTRDAGCVGEALAALEAGSEPACVVLDLMLPDGAGEVVLRRLRAAGSAIRVVVCTATANPERLAIVRALAPAELLPKPIDLAALLAALGAAGPGLAGPPAIGSTTKRFGPDPEVEPCACRASRSPG
jgi:two-component system OmpR family response regulator